ncbi:Protein MAK11 [Wickerhamiella sorbophila]|uniref:Protein MAK11 n=1 Tax=Wickerhamiella sorbophila TaxID=45607 RepID=A0A2T0FDR7_9ASCO|nr:Protein MAK11 [Wickerhamiella sorbophila]PRT53079.1 Protein MAK11 [Wickerhamiella sorbophila]
MGKTKAGKEAKDEAEVIPNASIEELDTLRNAGRTVRIVTGSYEHNLLCVALTITPKGEVFTPIFHFTPHTQSIRCLARHKRFLVSGSNDELIRLYDLQRRRELGTLMHHSGQVLSVQFFNKWMFSTAGDNKILIWRIKDWELLAELKGHRAPVVDFAVHKSGKIAISVGEDHKLILWNMMTGRKASIEKLPGAPRQVVWVPGGNMYYVAYDMKIIGSNDLPEIALKSRLHRMKLVHYKKDYLVVSLENGHIEFYDMQSGKLEFDLVGHASRVKDFDTLENLMVSVSSDGKIVVWDLESRDQIAVYAGGDRLNCVALIPDEIEHIVKRPASENYSDYESEPETNTKVQKRKKKKAKVIVER